MLWSSLRRLVWGKGVREGPAASSPHPPTPFLSASAFRGDLGEAPQPLRGQEVRAPCDPRAARQGLRPRGVRLLAPNPRQGGKGVAGRPVWGCLGQGQSLQEQLVPHVASLGSCGASGQ